MSVLAYPADCGSPDMREGYRPAPADDLAVDYARVFLGAGEANGKAAYPYESVYTSPEGLVRQEARARVRAIYAAGGGCASARPTRISKRIIWSPSAGGRGLAPVRTTMNHFYSHPEIYKSVHIIA